ncbi:MAG: hypothetical protein ABR553_09245, partial [Gammaproteobacteria bacterium]
EDSSRHAAGDQQGPGELAFGIPPRDRLIRGENANENAAHEKARIQCGLSSCRHPIHKRIGRGCRVGR